MQIIIKNARLSFPSLFKKSVFNGQEGKFEATFLFPKSDTKTKELIDQAIKENLADAKIKVGSDKLFIKDGDDIFAEKGYSGYEDHWAVKAGSNTRIGVVDGKKNPIAEEDGKIYAGCYVNVIVAPWVQNNQYGKRINANCLGVQFVKDGEPFGAGGVDASGDFDTIDDSEDAELL